MNSTAQSYIAKAVTSVVAVGTILGIVGASQYVCAQSSLSNNTATVTKITKLIESSVSESIHSAHEGRSAFHNLLVSRAAYLEGLPLIGDNWISGEAKAPTQEVCSYAKVLLERFEQFLITNSSNPEYPKLVLGPIPSGGVGIELTTNLDGLYIQLYNDQKIEVDLEKNGYFTSKEITKNEFEEELETYFRPFAV